MNIFYTKTTDPAYNLALEEYLFKSTTENWFFLWQNDNAVIIGKNQVALKEVDSRLADENNTRIVRRMTGGGAVYHDMGNVNYSYIVNSGDNSICFERYTESVIRYLDTLGVEAEFGGRNDILVEGRKISGNAQNIFNGRVLHHGTLLFSADLEYASAVLTPNSKKMQSKAVDSVKSRIANICEFTKEPITTQEFIDGLLSFITNDAKATPLEPTAQQIEGANELRLNRYATFGWNLGESPRYSLNESKRFDFGTVNVSMDISEGVITELSITGDFFGTQEIELLCERIKGTPHKTEEIKAKINDITDFIRGMSEDDFLELLF